MGYGRQVGGGTVHFNANYWRFLELDFKERSIWGEIAGTGFSDWPITYQDLEPYYTKAEYDTGVSGLAGANPFEAPRSKPYPVPPMPNKSSSILFDRGAKKLGLHPFPAPVAILSKDYNGRVGCVHCGYCPRFGCEVGAKSSSLASTIRMAERTKRCEVRADSYVSRIETNAQGRVTGVAYFDKNRKEQFQKAKAVAVCANGGETPRLLLLSHSSRFPNGLGNSSGMVGKYLMFDVGTMAHGLFEHPLNGLQGGHALGIGDRLAAGGADFPGDRFGWISGAFVIPRKPGAQIINDNLGPFARGDQRRLAPDPIAASGDHNHLAVKNAHNRHLP